MNFRFNEAWIPFFITPPKFKFHVNVFKSNNLPTQVEKRKIFARGRTEYFYIRSLSKFCDVRRSIRICVRQGLLFPLSSLHLVPSLSLTAARIRKSLSPWMSGSVHLSRVTRDKSETTATRLGSARLGLAWRTQARRGEPRTAF